MTKRIFVSALIMVLGLAIFTPIPAQGSEQGRRNTAYLLALLTGYAGYTGNAYAIGATAAGTAYSVKRLNDAINDRHRREDYCRQPQCCPTCGRGYYEQPPCRQYYDNGPATYYYQEPSNRYNYGYDGLVPERASTSNRDNYSIGYTRSGPTFRYNSSSGQNVSYSRPRASKQPQTVIYVIRER